MQRLSLVGKTSGSASLILSTGNTLPVDGATALTTTVRARRVPAPGMLLEVYAPTVWYRSPDSTGATTCTITLTREDGNTSTRAVTLTQTVTGAAGAGTLYQVSTFTIDGIGLADALVIDVTIALTQSGGAGDIVTLPAIDRIDIPYREYPVVAR